MAFSISNVKCEEVEPDWDSDPCCPAIGVFSLEGNTSPPEDSKGISVAPTLFLDTCALDVRWANPVRSADGIASAGSRGGVEFPAEFPTATSDSAAAADKQGSASGCPVD